MSQAFTRVRKLAGVAADIHLHSPRHLRATALDPVVSERQKRARLGWSTVQVSRHYTDARYRKKTAERPSRSAGS